MDSGSGDTQNSVDRNWVAKRLECYQELGYALFYMKFLNPEWRDSEAGEAQYQRVKMLCRQVAVDSRSSDLAQWEYWKQRIMDEIENLC